MIKGVYDKNCCNPAEYLKFLKQNITEVLVLNFHGKE